MELTKMTQTRVPRTRDKTIKMKKLFIFIASGLAITASHPSRAQVLLDVSKITCSQFVTYKVEDPKHIAIWISGYEHGKRGNTVLDVQRLMADADKLEKYCIQNDDMPVMRAFETILSSPE
jgi:acid stress chaperone HdeB